MPGEFLTLVDWAKRTGPDGGISRRIIERMAVVDPMWELVPFTQCNDGWDHMVVFRTAIPEPYWTAIGEGAPFTKSQTDQIKEGIGWCEDWIQVPKRLADKAGDRVEFMKSEAVAHGQGFDHVIQRTIFYGNRKVNPRQFHGLAPRFNDLSLDNVLSAGGSGSGLTSLWLVIWGEKTVYGIFPEEGKAQVQMDPAEVVDAEDANGNLYKAIRQHMEWGGGLAVEDPRYIVRIANIDLTTAVEDSTLGDKIIDAYHTPPVIGGGKAMWLGNRQSIAYLVKLAKAQTNLALGWTDAFGRKIPDLWGIPLLKAEAILNSEEEVQ